MSEKFAEYTVEDFLKDQDFIGWVLAPNPAKDVIWTMVQGRYPFQSENMQNARHMILQLAEASKPDVNQELKQEIWDNIQNGMDEVAMPTKPSWQKWMPWFSAASIVLVTGLFFLSKYKLAESHKSVYGKLIEQEVNALTEVVNDSDTTLLVTLPDASSVTLQKNSRLSYEKDFSGHERKVFLSGAAFFNVTKNPSKPFLVYANELVTKVLGTSFLINAFEQDKQVTVAVSTGRVSVFANKYAGAANPEQKGMILVPNQKASFVRKTESFKRSLVDMPQVIVSEEELHQFGFSNEPVTTIFDALEHVYGVDIVYDKEVLAACRLTTSLGNETLFEQLNIICEAIDAHYKVMDAQIFISGKKCN